ncbi:MAG: D-alanine--D-alanine ligase [Pseudomonadota bacterium]
MRIGLTYDLRADWSPRPGEPPDLYAEFDSAETITALRTTLAGLGHEPCPIGTAANVAPYFSQESVDLVFNIAEGFLGGRGRESQVPCLLDLLKVPYVFSEPLVLALTLDKAMAKRLLLAEGIPTARFVEVAAVSELDGLALAPPLFLKPVHEGSAKGVSAASLVSRPDDLRPRVVSLLAAYRQPVLIEEYLPGEEFTVAILGTGSRAEVLGTMRVSVRGDAHNVYGYEAKEFCESLVDYTPREALPPALRQEVEAVALAAWRALGCADAGRVDVRCNARGEPQFLEVNPLPGLHPTHSDLPIIATQRGLSYSDLIGRILTAALERHGLPQT